MSTSGVATDMAQKMLNTNHHTFKLCAIRSKVTESFARGQPYTC